MSDIQEAGVSIETGCVAILSVGTQLRAAREAAQLSIDEVAHALKFSPRQIEALEGDQYGALPGATIVRGFVRSYARLLKLDADLLLGQLASLVPAGPADVRPPDNMGAAGQAHTLREASPFVALLLVVVLASGLLVLWHFFGPVAPRPAPLPKPAEELQAPAQEPVTRPAVENPPVVSGAPGASMPPAEGAMPPAAMQESAVPALRFSFTDRSWVEVIDASRQLLHSGENPGGSQLSLTGRPPFEIVIGNAGKVTLTYGDRTVDLAPYTRADVARFTLE